MWKGDQNRNERNLNLAITNNTLDAVSVSNIELTDGFAISGVLEFGQEVAAGGQLDIEVLITGNQLDGQDVEVTVLFANGESRVVTVGAVDFSTCRDEVLVINKSDLKMSCEHLIDVDFWSEFAGENSDLEDLLERAKLFVADFMLEIDSFDEPNYSDFEFSFYHEVQDRKIDVVPFDNLLWNDVPFDKGEGGYSSNQNLVVAGGEFDLTFNGFELPADFSGKLYMGVKYKGDLLDEVFELVVVCDKSAVWFFKPGAFDAGLDGFLGDRQIDLDCSAEMEMMVAPLLPGAGVSDVDLDIPAGFKFEKRAFDPRDFEGFDLYRGLLSLNSQANADISFAKFSDYINPAAFVVGSDLLVDNITCQRLDVELSFEERL